MAKAQGNVADVSTSLDMTRALLVFVQQLAHLLDRERLGFSVERLLICAFAQKRPVTCIRTRGDLFPGLRCVTNTAGGLSCVG